MRGEEHISGSGSHPHMELPPHARRRELVEGWCPVALGITSACAEKRQWLGELWSGARNYLRMRGEEEVPNQILF